MSDHPVQPYIDDFKALKKEPAVQSAAEYLQTHNPDGTLSKGTPEKRGRGGQQQGHQGDQREPERAVHPGPRRGGRQSPANAPQAAFPGWGWRMPQGSAGRSGRQ